MSHVIRFQVVGLPKPKGSMRFFPHKTTGKIYMKHDNPGTVSWAARVTEQALAHRPRAGCWDGPCAVTLTFGLPRPKGHYGKSGLKPSAPKYPVTKPDLDKLSRNVKDALKHVVYRDDAQVVKEAQEKTYAEVPGVIVQVELMEERVCPASTVLSASAI